MQPVAQALQGDRRMLVDPEQQPAGRRIERDPGASRDPLIHPEPAFPACQHTQGALDLLPGDARRARESRPITSYGAAGSIGGPRGCVAGGGNLLLPAVYPAGSGNASASYRATAPAQ